MPIALALASAVTYGSADFFGGLAARRNAAATVVLLSQLAGVIVLVPCLGFAPQPISRFDVRVGMIAGAAGAIAIVTLYAALGAGRMGVVSPINAAVGASVPVAFGLLIGERPGRLALYGVALAFVAVILVSLDDRTFRVSFREPGVALAVASGFAIGALYVALGGAHGGAGFGRLAVARAVSLVLLTGYVALRRAPLRPATGTLRFILPAGLLDMTANALYVLAAHGGMLSLVAIVTSLYPVSTVLLARFVLNERLMSLQWIGVACALGGVVCIAL